MMKKLLQKFRKRKAILRTYFGYYVHSFAGNSMATMMLSGVTGQRVFRAPSQVRRVTYKKSAPANAQRVRAVPGQVAVPATTAIAFGKPSSCDSEKSSRGDSVVVSASASNTESAAGCVIEGKAFQVGWAKM